MSSSFNGLNITKHFEAVSRCGIEINALSQLLSSIFKVELSRRDNSLLCLLVGKEKIQSSSRMDDSEWVCTDTSISFPLKSKGKQKSEKYLSIQISLTGDTIINNDSEPLLHVCLWDAVVNFKDDYYMGFPLEKPDDVIADRLIVWSSGSKGDWKELSWTFSVQLVSLNSEADLIRLIVNPVLELLKIDDLDNLRKNIDNILPKDFLGIISYEKSSLT